MLHHVIVKFNDTVKDKKGMSIEVGNLFKGFEKMKGFHKVDFYLNCMDIDNRYDVMIKVDMDKDAFDDYCNSSIHDTWLNDYGKYVLQKAIFDCE